jgi:hypothetical protein
MKPARYSREMAAFAKGLGAGSSEKGDRKRTAPANDASSVVAPAPRERLVTCGHKDAPHGRTGRGQCVPCLYTGAPYVERCDACGDEHALSCPGREDRKDVKPGATPEASAART